MKTATFPSLRVDPALRQAAENVLLEGESLSGFVEHAVRAQIELRTSQDAFIARGLASRDIAKRTGVYYGAGEVVDELKRSLALAQAGSGSMSFRVRFTEEARADIKRLYAFALERADGDWTLAERAVGAIDDALALLRTSPFSCRKAAGGDALLRELIIAFGATGYVALFEIEDSSTVTVLAVRHQREDDYH